MVTAEQIADVYGIKLFSVNKFYPFLRKWMEFYNINTPLQQAQFLAQIGHESGRFYYTEEIASGEAYEWRKDLDNNIEGYGVEYKGRGLIQITGFVNYKSLSDDTGIDFVKYPKLLEEPEYAAMSACWYWDKHKLNNIAGDIVKVTKKINGGLNGYEDRLMLFNKFKKELGI